MHIEPAMCPACSTAFDPLRSRAVTVIDGRVRAFCSVACRDGGPRPAEPSQPITATHALIAPPLSGWRRWPREQIVLAAAAALSLAVFVMLIQVGRHRNVAQAATFVRPTVAARSAKPADLMNAFGLPAIGPQLDEWIQP